MSASVLLQSVCGSFRFFDAYFKFWRSRFDPLFPMQIKTNYNIINTENSSYTYNLRTRADFSQNRQKTDRPTSSKKLRGWCCWSCEENKSHEYQHNIKTLVRDWWLLLPDGKGVKFTRFPHKALWHSSLAVKWQFIFFSYLYTVFATTDPLSVPIANIVIPPIILLSSPRR